MAEVIESHFPTWPWQYWAAERPSAVALSFDGQSFGWAEVAQRVDDYAQGLIEQGVKRDQLIAVVAANSVSVVWLLLATLRVGARIVVLNPRFSAVELERQLAALVCDFVWYPSKQAGVPSGYTRLQLLPAKQPRLVPVTWQPTRAATLTLTSGSTGLPKAVVHSAQNHLSSAEGLLERMAFDADDSWLLSLPLFHISGLAIVWRWLLRGARLVLCPPQQLEQSLADVTHASLVPTQLQRLLAGGRPTNLALKRVLLGGAVIPVSLTEQARAAGIECWCGYGMTEMASTVTAKLADQSTGVGYVLPNRNVAVRNGEAWVSGATLCLGYYRNRMIFPAGETEFDGVRWFATKDLAFWQDEELHISGRADNMFISGGENIQPEEIEKVLMAHPEVDQVFVLPVEDHEFGSRPVALVVSGQPFTSELAERLADYMAEQVSGYRRPVRYLPLPETLGGGIKISRAMLAQWLTTQ